MSVSSLVTKILYVTDGITGAWPIPYYFIQPQDLLVQTLNPNTSTITNYTLNTHYTVTGVTNLVGDYINGGTLTFNTVPASGLILLIQRVSARTQEVLLVDNIIFNASILNHVHDKAVLLAQEGFIDGYLGIALGPPALGFPTYQYGNWFKNGNPQPGQMFGWILTEDNVWNAFRNISLSF
jgi:hypothetical protein